MARINISIPDELQSSMNQIEGVNWSSVAQKAFQTEVAARAKGNDMESAIQRLKASKEQFISTGKAAWTLAGQEWAAKEASYSQLRKISKLHDDYVSSDYEADELLRSIVRVWANTVDISNFEVAAFKSVFAGEGVDIELEYLEWWLDGAMTVWEAYVDSE